jgi:hypothetical protein
MGRKLEIERGGRGRAGELAGRGKVWLKNTLLTLTGGPMGKDLYLAARRPPGHLGAPNDRRAMIEPVLAGLASSKAPGHPRRDPHPTLGTLILRMRTDCQEKRLPQELRDTTAARSNMEARFPSTAWASLTTVAGVGTA